MPPTLRALLEHVIDYAGLFPPAKLPLAESLRNYLAYRASPQSWMLGGFVCPADRLNDLSALLSTYAPGSLPRDYCVIASLAESLTQTSQVLRDDLRRTSDFARAISGVAKTNAARLSLELRLPPDGCSPDAQLGTLLDEINRTSNEFDLPLGPVFLETPLDESSITAVAQGVSSFLWRTNGVFGLKFRTGGLDAAAYPSCEALACGIAACRDRGLPYKLTAGLHQPLRHAEPELGTVAHGFLNVLVAAVLADVHRGLAAGDIQAILEEERADTFAVDAREVRWREHAATLPEIRAARERGLISFGSCSFDEPLEGLRALGWES